MTRYEKLKNVSIEDTAKTYEPLTFEDGVGIGELIACFICDPGPDNEKCGMCEHFEEAIQRLFELEKEKAR